MKRTRVPRASLAVSLLRDSDFIGLFRTVAGRAAFGIFVALVLRAKDKDNGGRFVESLRNVSEAVHVTPAALRRAIELIAQACRENGEEPWVIFEGDHIIIRSYLVWNPKEKRGGARDGAGRPIKDQSNRIQTETPPQVGIGNGRGSSLTEGSLRGTIGAGDRYCVRDIWARLKEVVPANRRPGQRDILDQLAELDREGVDLESVIDPAAAYYQTPVSRSNRGWGMLTFLRGGHYDDDPSAWVGRDEEPDKPPDPTFTRTPEQDAARVAEMKRERAQR